MIDPDLVITQLTSLGLFALVGGAAEVATLMEPGKALGEGPNAYVVPLAEEPQPPKSAGGPQVVVGTIGVVMMVRRHGDALGGRTMNRLTPLRRALRAGLLGWSPEAGIDPLFFRGGRLLHFEPTALWWQDDFSARYGIAPTIV